MNPIFAVSGIAIVTAAIVVARVLLEKPKKPDPMAPPSSPSVRGLLKKSVDDGTFEQPTWVEIPFRGLTVLVGAHCLRAPVNGKLLRLGVSWKEHKEICRKLGWIPPTAELSDAIWQAAQVRTSVPWQGPKDMMSLATAERFNARLDQQIAADKKALLAADEGKDWIWSNRLLLPARNGALAAANYGGRDVSGKPVQGLGPDGAPTMHDADHPDYSQLVRPIQRFAKDGTDLVDVFIGSGIIPKVFEGWR